MHYIIAQTNLKIAIEKYKPQPKNPEMYTLWRDTLATDWAINELVLDQQLFHDITPGVRTFHAVAKSNTKIVGFITAKYKETSGQIMAIIVSPEFQRRGIGTDLITAAVNELCVEGVSEVSFGTNPGKYFWPGLPENLPIAKHFFSDLGWRFGDENVDMIQNIQKYETPAEIVRKQPDKINFSIANPDAVKQISAFTKSHFANWIDAYTHAIKNDRFAEILLATNDIGDIVGQALLFTSDFIWQNMFDGPVGGFGALGVKESERGKGIGLALSARATEILQERGMQYSFLGWTYLVDWYGKLGYTVWRRYKECKKAVN